MLGYLIRCLYYRDQRCISGGWCKASWIAEVFRMDLRSIKAARKHLVTIGWLRLCDTPQTLCNRWGAYALISLSWTRTTRARTAEAHLDTCSSGSPPPPAFCTTGLPPLSKEHQQPFQELQHQNPRDRRTSPHPPHRTSTEPPPPADSLLVFRTRCRNTARRPPIQPPTLRHIVPEDLQDTGAPPYPLCAGPDAGPDWEECQRSADLPRPRRACQGRRESESLWPLCRVGATAALALCDRQ